jgi:hypothetical protein
MDPLKLSDLENFCCALALSANNSMIALKRKNKGFLNMICINRLFLSKIDNYPFLVIFRAMFKRILFTFLSMYLLFVLSCKKADDNPPPPITEGFLKGSVSLFDEGTNALSNEGMKVSLENSDPEISVLTDAEGDYNFENLAYGVYTLVFSKENYGTYKLININHNENTNILAVPSLGEKSSTEITSLSVSQFETDILISITCSPAANADNPRYIRYFLGLNSDVNSTQYMYSSMIETADSDPFVITLTQANLNDFGFASSSEVFVRAYGESYWSNEYDDTGGATVFPNINLTTVDAYPFIVP